MPSFKMYTGDEHGWVKVCDVEDYEYLPIMGKVVADLYREGFAYEQILELFSSVAGYKFNSNIK